MKKVEKENVERRHVNIDLENWITAERDQKSTPNNPKERHINSGGWTKRKDGQVFRLQ
jgi:hypothetical protein